MPEAPRPRSSRRVWLWAMMFVWLGSVSAGLWQLWAYENRPGLAAAAPEDWPTQTQIKRATDRPTLVFVAHPQCTCTRASLEELAEILARARNHPKAYVLFLKPDVFEAGWEQTDLWRSASALPNVTVLRDDEGVEARRFGVETSGQTLLYDNNGALIFSGGITGSRGHAGENAGELALVSLLTSGQAAQKASSVFGCSLFARAD